MGRSRGTYSVARFCDATLRASAAGRKAASKRCLRSAAAVSTVKLCGRVSAVKRLGAGCLLVVTTAR
eukprot:CAMPEP_0118840754 /NCGR_PEP_ID=MMETSP1162-20130426/73970_1 /TAXON_ID=33656 /ORGANISM="Phaeocystis Sp, Strain CCMP2710" /LENGTH=66 /DNA_ID=CAMNT_0006772777 /DNA_START=26 /DNA_END=222 /DNA_ORIENTATION=+